MPKLTLDHIRAGEAMHLGILYCEPDAQLRDVAEIMAKNRVHALATTDADGTRPVGIISDLDIVTAINSGEEPTAAQIAATEPVTVSSDEPLQRAAQLMAEHAISHLVVVDANGGKPVGVISTLDLAAVYADGAGG